MRSVVTPSHSVDPGKAEFTMLPDALDTRCDLRLTLESNWSLKGLVDVLTSLRNTHASLSLFIESFSSRDDMRGDLFHFHGPFFSPEFFREVDGRKHLTPSELQRRILSYSLSLLSPLEDLAINSVNIQSPGWLEVLGKLSPLQAIKDIIEIIRDWKTTKRQKELDNALYELRIIRQAQATLKEAGVSKAQIKNATAYMIWKPMQSVVNAVDNGQITGAEIIPLPPPPPPRPSP
jgi:hypothetical protein